MLFDPSSTRTRPSGGNELGVEHFVASPIILDTDGFLPQFPLDASASPSGTLKVMGITPFDPELGYTITNEDLEMESRIKKVFPMQHEVIETVKAPLSLHLINRFSDSLKSLGLTHQVGLGERFYPEYLSKIKQLRVQLFFPNGLRFEGKPDDRALALGGIAFDNYYPVDTGPLPASKDTLGRLRDHMDEGFGLYVPSDKSKVTQIRARIIRVDEEETEGDDVEEIGRDIKPPDNPPQTKTGNGVPDAINDAFKDDKDW